jgi:hypothetical protein
MNIRLGDTVEVVEVARGEVANEVEAASDGNGATRIAASASGRKWCSLEAAGRGNFMIVS